MLFGLLMALFARGSLPGAPYLLAAFLSLYAALLCWELPAEPREEEGPVDEKQPLAAQQPDDAADSDYNDDDDDEEV
jgi:hypothetical protein